MSTAAASRAAVNVARLLAKAWTACFSTCLGWEGAHGPRASTAWRMRCCAQSGGRLACLLPAQVLFKSDYEQLRNASSSGQSQHGQASKRAKRSHAHDGHPNGGTPASTTTTQPQDDASRDARIAALEAQLRKEQAAAAQLQQRLAEVCGHTLGMCSLPDLDLPGAQGLRVGRALGG